MVFQANILLSPAPLVEALRSKGGRDGILTLSEITPFVEKLKITPRAGRIR